MGVGSYSGMVGSYPNREDKSSKCFQQVRAHAAAWRLTSHGVNPAPAALRMTRTGMGRAAGAIAI